MKYFMVVGLAGLLSFPHIARSQENAQSCSLIDDPTERLRCFDRQFPADSIASEPPATSPPHDTAGAVEQSSDNTLPLEPGTTTATAAPSSRGLFSEKEPFLITSRLESVRDRDKQKMVFRLENDQIWLQDSPRSLPFREGDEVTIRSATIGGYILSNHKGVSTRVRQIK
ncbi:MAG: hypothetical protein ACFHXK_18600 [bacterium]